MHNIHAPQGKHRITCQSWRPLRKNTLLGFASCRIDGVRLTIKDIAIHEKNNSTIAPPRTHFPMRSSPPFWRTTPGHSMRTIVPLHSRRSRRPIRKSRSEQRLRAMSVLDIRPIETVYKGYRFRSRLEARWAVFLDAAGIEWEYEAEGYVVGGIRYLPDFWLPGFKAFLEAKPIEAEYQRAKPTMSALVKATGLRGIFAVGSPNLIQRPKLIECSTDSDRGDTWEINLRLYQCLFCDRLSLDYSPHCDCFPADVCFCDFGNMFDSPPPRVDHAFKEAQGARFEHGEDGTPQPYSPAIARFRLTVYVAGPVLEEDGAVLPWRTAIFPGCEDERAVNRVVRGRFVYGGPSIFTDHGCAYQGLAPSCLDEVKKADALFAWIDRQDTIGTIAEIGAAHAMDTPIFVAFANGELVQHFYFAQQLATIALTAPSAAVAWDLFVRWQNRQTL